MPRVIFPSVCRCRDDAINLFITLISGLGFITRRVRQCRNTERRGRDRSRSRLRNNREIPPLLFIPLKYL